MESATKKIHYFGYPGLDKNIMSPMQMIDAICDITNVTFDQVKSKTRVQYILDARYLIVYFLHKKFRKQYSLMGISRMVNLNSHATALHSLKRTEELKLVDKDFREKFVKIEKRIL